MMRYGDDQAFSENLNNIKNVQNMIIQVVIVLNVFNLRLLCFSWDQWMSSQPSPAKPEMKSGGMKASTSAPSRLPSAKTPQKDSLFYDDDEDDLFTVTKEPR